ncbi:hypothetical protein BGW39_003040 [Mortierella sp. 14UC]|nr:hypothetical protein BGW39_003040 [Mortierella sp. 14UC]
MATVTASSSKRGPSTHHLHSTRTIAISSLYADGPDFTIPDSSLDLYGEHDSATPAASSRAPGPVRILQCGICLDDFEWFSLKNVFGYQEDPQDETLTTPLALLPRIRKRSSTHILCSHGRGHGVRNLQARIRWTSGLFGGYTARREEKRLKKKIDDDAPLPLSVEGLKLGCSLHYSRDHAFCMECLARYIDTQVKAHAWPIVCPTEKCNESVSSFAVEILLGNDALQWHRLGVEHAIQKKIYCPYVDCGRLIDGDCNDENEPVDNNCPYCAKPFCAMCLGKAHKGNNCEQRQDKIFESLATERKWKSCPSCRLMIEKESGCNHMTCRCGCHFCYVCGSNGVRCNNGH